MVVYSKSTQKPESEPDTVKFKSLQVFAVFSVKAASFCTLPVNYLSLCTLRRHMG